MHTLLKLGVAAGAAYAVDSQLGFSKDLFMLNAGRQTLKFVEQEMAAGRYSQIDRFLLHVARKPNEPFLVYQEEAGSGVETVKQWTWKEVDIESNKIAHLLLHLGVRPGDMIAVLYQNTPEFIFIMLATWKIGASCALLNHHQRGRVLLHSVGVSRARLLLFEAAMSDAVAEAYEWNEGGVSGLKERGLQLACFSLTAPPDFPFPHLSFCPNIIDLEHPLWCAAVPAELRRAVGPKSVAYLVYTSGTTGMPKATNLSHVRLCTTVTFRYLDVFREGERIYPVGPFFHFNAQIGIMHGLNLGDTICFTRRFSASNFFAFCAQTGVNCFPFVGEFLRFILYTPPSPWDRNHKVRSCGGNGVRPDIWGPFEQRFGVRINEGYGSTEGVVGSFNPFGKQGAVGFQGILVKALNPQTPRIVKIDPITEELVRDPKTGFCIECSSGEPGEMIGRFINENFEGYFGDDKSTNKKFVRDVFEKGDTWWRSGDLLFKDWRGWVYFVDRIGDTFRWKGENVSTTEVRDVLLGFSDLEDANVYGVQIPGLDGMGRTGTAAVIFKDHVRNPEAYERKSLRALSQYVKRQLPPYAIPRFLRVYQNFDAVSTVTFKHRKVELQKEGFDPSKISERLYFFDEGKGGYVSLTPEVYNTIVAGKAKL
ncbi:acetyl-CoA synthetase-like protein [Gonapodya prolifera JEL478]|uniref:Acetyl-CoA synthetase-like protein n=1 Tax=Gonapodya prolifera (strain JEL478) TaxID=1344416 RepID=A0A139AYV7_GONPJ|nr:acetyl-CoA synthetase-like protein [Gonapodya prolifera JEL478]|eukprot:KXS21743.1 acetyl-CoA synthetase-like protein [Gonapodya prolifera JEL478]